MEQDIKIKGIVLAVSPQGESDRRLTFLSSELGKITIFANGARRPKSPLAAAARAFSMGDYTVRQGRTAYSLVSADIIETFDGLSVDMDKFCYASYMCEFAGYYTRENVTAKDELNLLYVSFKNLLKDEPDMLLAKALYELRLMHIEGEGPNLDVYLRNGKADRVEHIADCLQYIEKAPLTRLYDMQVSSEKRNALIGFVDKYKKKYVDKEFKSLEILNTLY